MFHETNEQVFFLNVRSRKNIEIDDWGIAIYGFITLQMQYMKGQYTCAITQIYAYNCISIHVQIYFLLNKQVRFPQKENISVSFDISLLDMQIIYFIAITMHEITYFINPHK